jgi:hypothetical protein
MPTIKISEETHKMLIKRQAEIMQKTGKRITLDEVIKECLKNIGLR